MNCENFSDLPIKKMLVMSALYMPILQEAGMAMPRPVAVVLEKLTPIQIVNSLTIWNVAAVVEATTPIRALKNELRARNSDFIFYLFGNSSKDKVIIEMLCNVVSTGQIEGKTLNVLPVVFFTKMIPNEFKERFFVLREEWILLESVRIEDVLVNSEQVMHALGAASWDRSNPLKVALKSVLCILREKEDTEKRVSIKEMDAKLDAFVAQEEADKDGTGLVDAFLKCLYQWQTDKNFSDLCFLPNLEMDVISKIDRVICADEKYLYFPETLFAEITSPLENVFSRVALKRCLGEAGVIDSDLSSYTAKMPFYDPYGCFHRIRRIRIKISEVNVPGELPFIDICGGENNA